jgi:astacin
MKTQEIIKPSEFPETTNASRAGFIAGSTFDRKQVQYAAINGWRFSGTSSSAPSKSWKPRWRLPLFRSHLSKGVPAGPWGYPYQIAATLPNQSRVTDAIAHWEARTVMRFVRRTASDASYYPNFVSFEPASGCSSPVGMKGASKLSV